MQGLSWPKAYGMSLVFHIIVLGVAGLFIAGTVAHQEQQQMYVVDLDSSDLQSAGSGHAGGGGGGNSNLFPEKLSDSQMEQKMAQATQAPTPTANHPSVPPTSDTVPTPDTSSSQSSAPFAAPSAAPAPSGYSGGSSDAGSSGGYGTGSGSGTGSGVGEGTGSGEGGGSGSGYGDGVGDGQGYGEGSGDGQGSGDSGAEGTGTGAFDESGLWAAINANKTYPPMAVRRGLTGSVTIQTTIDPSGTITSVSVVGSSGQSILDKAAVQAAYNVGSYPNPTGSTVTATTTVTFNLN